MPSSPAELPSVALSLVSCPPEQAQGLAQALVDGRFAACVSVLPGLRSVYRWQGAVEQAEEALLLIKHPVQDFSALKDAVLRLHPYELPEVLMVSVDAGHRPYLDWVLSACAK